ncbi:ABC transporter permease [Sphingobium sp.]|uniref:ABC transporter permease n=1 Tax=Sphingobium sp. TaxID=1912891 RepID=UPI003BB7F36F
MNKAADIAEETRDGGTVLRLSGSLAIANLHDLPARLDAIEGPVSTIDLSDVDHIDTIGAWVVHRNAKRLNCDISSGSDDAKRLIEAVGALDEPVSIHPDHVPAVSRVVGQIGEAVIAAGSTMLGLLGFFGSTLVASWNVIRHPHRFRLNAVVQRFEVVGVAALGIIGLMSFLIGIVIAQQGSVQLRQFGMEMLTINLVGRLTFRELGVLMTAIMVAGRSGSAFAAQLGTMKLTEEVDAMRTIGVSPMEALVLPRTMAVVIMMPLLSFYACILSVIGGGFLCWIALEIPPITFIQRLREVVPITDLWVGLIKAPVFGLIIAISGCFQGMQVKGNAEEVGLRTTAAVVQAIFLVIVIDAFFAVFFTWIGWN